MKANSLSLTLHIFSACSLDSRWGLSPSLTPRRGWHTVPVRRGKQPAFYLWQELISWTVVEPSPELRPQKPGSKLRSHLFPLLPEFGLLFLTCPIHSLSKMYTKDHAYNVGM